MVAALTVEQLSKRFGTTKALDELTMTVPVGGVRGLLGPNGAGKTTLVRVLATLLRPDSGRAEVLGLDVVRSPQQVRARIALTGQYAAVDELLTGQENLEMIGRLFRLERREARRRSSELLQQFDLADAADRTVRTYSGGMRRRLDLAASLMTRPQVLFLDEPTAGLDPSSRLEIWAAVAELARDGTTVLLTTQYLEEADRLVDEITVIDHGRVIAEGTPDQLKTEVGGARLELVVEEQAQLDAAARALRAHGDGDVTVEATSRRVTMPVPQGAGVLPAVVRDLDDADVEIADITVRRPTLDDVFLALTDYEGPHLAADQQPPVAQEARR
jgi:ABC-2 type transport system ATP-binding protein